MALGGSCSERLSIVLLGSSERPGDTSRVGVDKAIKSRSGSMGIVLIVRFIARLSGTLPIEG